MRDMIQAAAKANDHSVSEEIEKRLERSFANDEMRSIIREELAASVTPLSPHAWRMDRDTMGAALRQFHRETKTDG